MVMDFSRFGTRISLSDRFSQIRAEAIKQSNVINQSIGYGSGNPVKNFSETLRSERPSAQLSNGSEQNRRLVFKMSGQDSLLSEINNFRQAYTPAQTYAPAGIPTPARTYAPGPTYAPTYTRVKKFTPKVPISQRLGYSGNLNGKAIKPKGNVLSRLGKKPVHERLGVSRVSNRFQVEIIQKRAKGRFVSASQQGRRNPKNVKVNPKRINRKGPRLSGVRKSVTAEQLDDDLDSYMNHIEI